MKDADSDDLELTPELVLRAYGAGVFPMADSAEAAEIYWVDPRKRGILPLNGFHLSRSLARQMRRGGFSVRVDTAFSEVLDACADRSETWINPKIRELFLALYRLGYAHSCEVWTGGRLTGGIYGLCLGGAFFGESMFTRGQHGSKVALAYLVARLKVGGFTLFDTQFTTPHLEGLGARYVPRAHYHELLDKAVRQRADFYSLDVDSSVEAVLQRITQTS